MVSAEEDTMDRKWPKAVIFDMDGLMFASEQMIQRSWDEVGPELAMSLWDTIFFRPWE